MRSDAVGLAVDWRRRDALLLEHDAELDVRGVGEDRFIRSSLGGGVHI
jgi:hypothetical protein